MSFKKVVSPVTGKTSGNRIFHVYVTIIVENNKLSLSGVEGPLASGNCIGACGQIQDDFMKPNGEVQDGYVLADDWTPEMLMGLRVIWDAYHLNDMKSGCVHQEDAGYSWNENNGHTCPMCGYKFGYAWKYKNIPTEAIDFLVDLPEASKPMPSVWLR